MGVVPSPSRWCDERPFRPTRAFHGPATLRQQPRVFVQSETDAYVVCGCAATTSTSWFELPAATGGAQLASAAVTAKAAITRPEYAAVDARGRTNAAAVRRAGLCRDAESAALLVSTGLSRWAGAAAQSASPLLRLRQSRARGCPDRERFGHARRCHGVSGVVRGPLSHPPNGTRRGLSRQRRPIDGCGQHERLQLPLCGRARRETLVGTRLRRSDRREHRREPVRRGRPCSPGRRPAVSRPRERAARDGSPERGAREGIPLRRLEVGRPVDVVARLSALLRYGRIETSAFTSLGPLTEVSFTVPIPRT